MVDLRPAQKTRRADGGCPRPRTRSRRRSASGSASAPHRFVAFSRCLTDADRSRTDAAEPGAGTTAAPGVPAGEHPHGRDHAKQTPEAAAHGQETAADAKAKETPEAGAEAAGPAESPPPKRPAPATPNTRPIPCIRPTRSSHRTLKPPRLPRQTKNPLSRRSRSRRTRNRGRTARQGEGKEVLGRA